MSDWLRLIDEYAVAAGVLADAAPLARGLEEDFIWVEVQARLAGVLFELEDTAGADAALAAVRDRAAEPTPTCAGTRPSGVPECSPIGVATTKKKPGGSSSRTDHSRWGGWRCAPTPRRGRRYSTAPSKGGSATITTSAQAP
ncbi:hypothetical protein [Demequina litorisediminis]|uniref:hypothetical protein n=1 Tax=Demequina litorisediminis TaxID=1849022 RepID=UPI0024E0F393|nr:hypothetical protein [Demequina litorisediminis]